MRGDIGSHDLRTLAHRGFHPVVYENLAGGVWPQVDLDPDMLIISAKEAMADLDGESQGESLDAIVEKAWCWETQGRRKGY